MRASNSRHNEGEIPSSKMQKLSKSILKTSKSLVKIDSSKYLGTGFFIKFFLKVKDFFC